MTDFESIFIWWLYLFGLGLLFLPISTIIFAKFFDKGYIFAKTISIVVVSYLVLLGGISHIFPFHNYTIFIILILLLIVNIFLFRKRKISINKKMVLIFILQEIFFFASLWYWSYIKSFQPDIHGLEKYMDYGFINSILRSTYFPPVDMWFPPEPINYYYFGHLVTAVLIKLTGIPNYIGYNLMLATIFAFTTTSAFSIVSTITASVLKNARASLTAGVLAGLLTSLAGNLHTIYTFFKPYVPAENPVPFWKLQFLPQSFPNNYWYPNATRFVPLTIHEFPSYSFVVSDLHGHVLDIPFVFLTIALVLSMFLSGKLSYTLTIITSFMLAIMYMTNAWDGIIYFLLLLITIVVLQAKNLKIKKYKNSSLLKSILNLPSRTTNKTPYVISVIKFAGIAGACYLIFSLPFSLGFKPFVSGVGVICAPNFLIEIGKIGPLLFESNNEVNHCVRSPFWMLVILYGFFYFFVTALIIKIAKNKQTPNAILFILILVALSTLLIAVPEFIYAKDIYPAHFRANTMFKLGYQAFMMLSMVSGFAIVYLLYKGNKIILLPVTLVLLALVFMYPYFSIHSYFGTLKEPPKGLNGISYLKTLHPEDYEAILWIEKNIAGQPVMLEAQGDSYTDYGRISANTGLPTPLGWTVHEWLWRGDYKFPESRLEDIKNLYEGSVALTRDLVKKYNIKYVYVGNLEREKYPNINESKFNEIGKIIFERKTTRIYEL